MAVSGRRRLSWICLHKQTINLNRGRPCRSLYPSRMTEEKKKPRIYISHHLKSLFAFLLEGAFLVEARSPAGNPKYKCYQGNMIPILWVTPVTYRVIKEFLRWDDKKKTRQVLDLRKVRALTLHHTFKIMYRERMKETYRQNLKGLKDK